MRETAIADACAASATEEHVKLALERSTEQAAMILEASAVDAMQRVANEEEASARSAIECPSLVATPGGIAAPPLQPPAHEEPIIGDVKTAAVDTPFATTMDAVQVATEAAVAAWEAVEVIKDFLSYTEGQLFNVAE